MTAAEIIDQLDRIALEEDFSARSAQVVELWQSAGVGVEAVDPVLHFFEEHPNLDFGMPGPLVHFIERFYGKGYEEKLVRSIERRPTAHTAWMLNRVINGTRAPEIKRRFVDVMARARRNPRADDTSIKTLNRFVERWERI